MSFLQVDTASPSLNLGIAIAIAVLLGVLLWRVILTSPRLVLAILILVLLSQYGLGIRPSQLLKQIFNLPHDLNQSVTQLARAIDLPSITSIFSD